jgi:tetratricopeptide (TPR) repeat protein
LDDEAIKVNGELEQLRGQMREEERKNEDLRKQLAAMQAQLKQGTQPGGARPATQTPGVGGVQGGVPNGARVADSAAAENDEGMRLYKEKRHADAAARFASASSLQPASALFANNAGFAYYRMKQYEDAAQWFLHSIAIDPKRAVAYLNLGDTYAELQRKDEARDAYEKFLTLSPNSNNAADVRAKVRVLR